MSIAAYWMGQQCNNDAFGKLQCSKFTNQECWMHIIAAYGLQQGSIETIPVSSGLSNLLQVACIQIIKVYWIIVIEY